ncbi:MAG: fatty acyl-AMP ligase [Solirubrobacterales bacterium]
MRAHSYRNFAQPLAINAEALPDFVAYIYVDDEQREHKITFGALHERALGIAHDLLESAQPGDRTLLLLPPGLDYVATIFGCFYAGVIGVSAPPPDPRRLERTLGRLLRIAESAGVSSVITTTPFLDIARSLIPAEHQLLKTRWLTADTSPSSADTSVISNPSPADVAFLQYTSGSTADPRGVRLTHGNLLDNSRFIATGFGIDPEVSLGFNWIPPFHDMGLIGAILQPVYFGGFHTDEAIRGRDPNRAASVLISPLAVVKRPIRWLQGIDHYKATTSGGPNFSYDMCVDRIAAEDCEGLDLSSWEVAFNGAEPIRAESMAAFSEKFRPHGFRPVAFVPVYGLAEATLMVTSPTRDSLPKTQRFDADALLENRAVPSKESRDPLLVGCGSPDGIHRVIIVNPETCTPVAPGEIGEIWVSGPSVADGYWSAGEGGGRLFEATLAGAESEHYLRTGDLGVFHDEELFVMGRLSDLIIVNGRNHHPHDIETLAEETASLLIPHASAAFELQAGDGEPRIALIAESKSADVGALQQAIAAVRNKVADDLELPLALAAVCAKGTVPKTTSGKIQRRLCRMLLLAGELEVVTEWRTPALAEGSLGTA